MVAIFSISCPGFIHCVWKSANLKRGKLLILEAKYAIPETATRHEPFYKIDHFGANPFYIKDDVDEIIEKVFERGGDDEYVENNLLKEYGNIVLIEN